MIHASPIAALIDYYKRLRDDPAADVAPFGFSRQKISFRIVIEANGRLCAIEDARQQDGKRMAPLQLVVPGQSKPSGSGINPGFLWDNAQYMLGIKPDDPKPERTAMAFAAFRQRHLDLADAIDDEQFAAACQFLETWDPQAASGAPGYAGLVEAGSGFGVIQVRATPGYVHDRSAVQEYWGQAIRVTPNAEDQAGDVFGQSLVSGRVAPLARLHEPKIKGVIGGQSSGGVLVGFNEDAYASYGKSQSYNAPVAVDEAFEYCTALNRLLSSAAHRVRLGDATVVFWSDRSTSAERFLQSIFGDDAPASNETEDANATQRVRHFFDAARRGVPHEAIEDAEAPFYVLGLSPNAARISLRFWFPDTVGHFAEQLADHVRNLHIVGDDEGKPLTIRRLLFETAREAKDIPPQLAGEITRAILSASRYPEALLTSVIRRVRADSTMNCPRAAILKACLIRNYAMEVPVALNKDHADPAYHMGRLFAVLEKTQQDTLPGLNKTIKGGYFATASSTPASVFPRLIRLHQHHIEKLEGGHKVNREKLVQEVCSRIDQFPAHLPIARQGLFQIGYYHQRQDFFSKREANDVETDTTSAETVNA